MRRGAKIAVWTAGGFVGLTVLLIGIIFVFANTDRGRAWMVQLAGQITGGQLQLAGLHGSFPAALDLDRLMLRDANGVWLWAERISLRWSPGALLTRHVNIETLKIGRLHIERAPAPQQEKKSSSGSSIPRSDLKNLSIDTLELGQALAGVPASLTVKGQAHLRSMQDATAYFSARRTSGNGNGDYEFDLHLDAARMEAMVKLQEPADGPLANLLKVRGLGPLSVLGRLNGPREAEVVQLSVDAGLLRARANGTVDLVHSAADLDYSLIAPAMAPYAGLAWDRLELNGRFHGPFATPAAQGHVLIRALKAPGGTQFDALEADASAQNGIVKLHAGVAGLQIPGPKPALLRNSPLSLDGSMRLNDASRPADFVLQHALFSLQAKLLTAGEQRADLTLHVPDVAPFAALGGQQAHGDAEIQARVQRAGTKTRFGADVESHLNGGAAAWAGLLRGAPVRLAASGELTDEAASIDRLQITGRALSLTATASAARTNAQTLKARFDVSLPDLSRASAALAGTLKMSGSVRGPRNDLNADVNLSTSLSAHGSPSGTIDAAVHARGLPRSPAGTVQARGSFDGAPLHLNVAVEKAAGNAYHAIIRQADWKSAHADGDITSGMSVAQAKGHVAFRMTNLSDLNRVLGSALAGSVEGRLGVAPLGGGARAQLDLSAKQVVAAGLTVDARLAATGPTDALRVSLDAQTPSLGGRPAQLDTAAVLNLAAKNLQLASFEAHYHDQNVHLLAPARIEFSNGFAVRALALGAQQARFEVDGELSPALNVHAAIRQLESDLINAFVPNLLASGAIEAEAQVRGSMQAPLGHVQLQALGVRAKSDAALGLPPADLRANVQLMGNTTRVEAHLGAGSTSQVALTGRTPLGASGLLDLKLAGNLDLGLLNPLLEAGGRHLTGVLAVDTSVKGSTAAPEITGSVRLSRGTFRDYTQGTNLSDITGELTGSHSLLRIEKLTARAAPGEVAIEGTVGVLQPKVPVDLKLTAKHAQPIASSIVTANIDSNIQVSGTAREQLDVSGNVHINRADITIPGGLPPSVAVLDVERAGQAPPSSDSHPLIVNLNIGLDAPRRILVKGRGLDAELGGALRIHGSKEAPVVEGGFELQRGFFTLASSKLTFTNGTVTFNGTGLQQKLDPSLDFTAQTKAAEITAVVRITGLADAPQIELSSTPELPQDEILARLLFGESAAQLSAVQLVETGAALASLRGGSEGSNLNPMAKIQKALGLDRLSVGGGSSTAASSSSQQKGSGTSGEAGRYVSSRVYVGVKESTSGTSQVDVDVDLTKRVKLQAKLGNGTATAQGVTPENDPGSSIGMAYQFEY